MKFNQFLGSSMVALAVFAVVFEGRAQTQVDVYGTYTNWPNLTAGYDWMPLSGLDDGEATLTGSSTNCDFVGNPSYPTAYWATNGAFVFFRVRVAAGNLADVRAASEKAAFFVYVDNPNAGRANYPDAIFAWDAASTQISAHGLENVILTNAPTTGTWNAQDVEDMDVLVGASRSAKISPPDFAYSATAGVATNGYIRTVEGVTCAGLNTAGNLCSFIDFAIEWRFLTNRFTNTVSWTYDGTTHNANSTLTNTQVARGQTWRVTFGSVTGGLTHEHQPPATDVAGNVDPSSSIANGWSGNIITPQYNTRVVLSDFQAGTRDGQTVVRWHTASEVDTLGFRVYRQTGPEAWTQVGAFVPSQGQTLGGIGATYEVVDAGAVAGGTYAYKLVEAETTGGTQEYGPFVRTAQELRLVSPLTVAGGNLVLRWLSRTNEVYTISRTANLTSPFVPLATGIPATPPQNSYVLPMDLPSMFYKIETQ